MTSIINKVEKAYLQELSGKIASTQKKIKDTSEIVTRLNDRQDALSKEFEFNEIELQKAKSLLERLQRNMTSFMNIKEDIHKNRSPNNRRRSSNRRNTIIP